MITSFQYRRATWFWNGFSGFYFQPISPTRNRERIIKESHPLYPTLRSVSGYP